MRKKIVIPGWIWGVVVGCLLALGQFERFVLPGGIGMYLHEVLLILLVIWGVAQRSVLEAVSKRMVSSSLNIKLFKAFLAFAGVGYVIHFFQTGFQFTPFLYLGRILLYFAGLFVVSVQVEKDKWSKSFLQAAMVTFASLLVYFGWLQYFLIPDTRWLFFLGWDDHYYRFLSSMLDPNFTGILLILFYCWVQSWKNVQLKIILSVVLAVSVLFTYSRSSYVALAVAMLLDILFSIKDRKWQHSLLVGVLILAAVSAIPFLPRPGGEGVKLERTSTIVGRQDRIISTLKSFNGVEWVVGKGLYVADDSTSDQTYQVDNHGTQADNWVLFLLSGTGIVGIVLLGILSGEIFFHAVSVNKYWSTAAVALLVHSLFVASMLFPFVLLFMGGWWVLVSSKKATR